MFEWLPDDVEIVRDPRVGDWFVPLLEPWGRGGVRLTSFMPGSFEAYARLFHPPDGSGVRWADLAAEHGVDLTPDVSFDEVTGVEFEEAYTLPIAPECGALQEDSCRALEAILEPHTSTPLTCFFGVFDTSTFESGILLRSGSTRELRRAHKEDMKIVEGERRQIAALPRIDVPNRRQIVFRGPITAACSLVPPGPWRHVSPSTWWPEDRAWMVTTDIDDFSTYVGGSRSLVDDVIASPDLEAIDVPADVRIVGGC